MDKTKPRIELEINFIDYVDEVAMGNQKITQHLITASEEVVKAGGKVTWLRTFENDEPYQMQVFETESDINVWKERLEKHKNKG